MSNTKALDDILNRLQIKGEARRAAEEIFREAIYLTRPGSAYAITQGPQVLPAACLFIASSRLGNTDITKEVARNAACVDLKTFEKVQSSIERALLSKSSPTKTKGRGTTFQSLIRQYDGREDAHVPMVEVERELIQSKTVEDTSVPLYQGAIFSWVYINIFELHIPGETLIRQQVQASLREWASARRNIDKCCSRMKNTLKIQAEAALRRPRRLRSNGTLMPLTLEFPVTPSKVSRGIPSIPAASSGRIAAMKRKTSITNLIEEISSPSKRPKAALVRSTDANSTSMSGNNSDQEIAEETIVSPELQSASHLATRNSNTLLNTIPDFPRKSPSRASLSETPGRVVENIVETPMTTTGISDTSSSPCISPVKIGQPSQPSRRRVQSLPALRKNHLPLMEEEASRRQRRNLQAAFLKPDVYGWKPSPVVSRKLKLAEIWEKTLIKNFGDPWNDLRKTGSEAEIF